MSEGVNSGGIRSVLSEVMCLHVEAVNELKGQRRGDLQVHLLLRESMRKPCTTLLHFPAPLPPPPSTVPPYAYAKFISDTHSAIPKSARLGWSYRLEMPV